MTNASTSRLWSPTTSTAVGDELVLAGQAYRRRRPGRSRSWSTLGLGEGRSHRVSGARAASAISLADRRHRATGNVSIDGGAVRSGRASRHRLDVDLEHRGGGRRPAEAARVPDRAGREPRRQAGSASRSRAARSAQRPGVVPVDQHAADAVGDRGRAARRPRRRRPGCRRPAPRGRPGRRTRCTTGTTTTSAARYHVRPGRTAPPAARTARRRAMPSRRPARQVRRAGQAGPARATDDRDDEPRAQARVAREQPGDRAQQHVGRLERLDAADEQQHQGVGGEAEPRRGPPYGRRG